MTVHKFPDGSFVVLEHVTGARIVDDTIHDPQLVVYVNGGRLSYVCGPSGAEVLRELDRLRDRLATMRTP